MCSLFLFMNELLFHEGGTLYLDEPFLAQPSAATITIRTLRDRPLSELHPSFDDIEDVVCDVSNLELTLPETNKGAKVFSPISTSGTVDDLTNPGYRMLIVRGGRRHYARVSEFDGAVSSFRLDEGLDFPLKEGDKAYGLRVSVGVDWTDVTSDFTGQVKATWTVTVDGKIRKISKVYDVVRQLLERPATWADVIARRPDVDTQVSAIKNKEQFVITAWEDVVTMLYNMGIRHNLIFSDNSTILRDVTVIQTLYNMTMYHSLPIPQSFMGQGDTYLYRLEQERNMALGQFLLPVDDNQDDQISPDEIGAHRRGVWFRTNINHRVSYES